jgi:hypothetical protein
MLWQGAAMQFRCSHQAFLAIAVCLAFGSTALGATLTRSDNAAGDPASERSRQMARRIDELLAQQWSAAKVEPAPVASDSEFLRRTSLDLTGVIPRASQVREFLADTRPDKRELLVDELLTSPRYATHMATTWRNRIIPEELDATRNREALALQKWLRTRFAKNLRYDNLVGELLLTIGGDELGPALYYQANDLSPEKLAGSAAQLFLGVRLDCAQCHDHPFADWSQKDFWGLAAFFARVRARDARGMGMMDARYRLVDASEGEVRLPDSSEVVPPKFPKGDSATDSERQSRRVQLAIWMTSGDNPFFARAAVNWAWTHLFGRGLVETLDDEVLAKSTPQAQLLDELAKNFIASGYNLKELWRTLASTKAYQLAGGHEDAALADEFAQMRAKPLTPEQLFDSFVLLAPGNPSGAGKARPAAMANSLDEDPVRIKFVRNMRAPPGDATEYRAGTLQALMLMNGRVAAGVSDKDASNVLGAIVAPFMNDEERIESLFIATLSRPPDDEERQTCVAMLAHCKSDAERNQAASDVLWALLNSTEFAFNH